MSTSSLKTTNRIKWIDVAKILGIYTIFLLHWGEEAGSAYSFSFKISVQIFFFISGCTLCMGRDDSFGRFILKKIKTILVPFFAFAAFSLLIYVILINGDLAVIKDKSLIILKGCVRNEYIAPTLWFLSCLFVMEIMFKIICFLKYRLLILGICIGIFVASNYCFDYKAPKLPYNVDSACYYLIFMCLGYVLFPYIEKLFKAETKAKKIGICVSGFIAVVYSTLVFEATDKLAPLENVPVLDMFIPVIRSMIIIWAFLFAAKMLEQVNILSRLGKESLYLCGNELVSKLIINSILVIDGVNLSFNTVLDCYIYCIIAILFSFYVLIPIEKKIANSIKHFFTYCE